MQNWKRKLKDQILEDILQLGGSHQGTELLEGGRRQLCSETERLNAPTPDLADPPPPRGRKYHPKVAGVSDD